MLKRTFSFMLALFMVVFVLPFSSMRSSAADENLLLYTYFDFSVYSGDKATAAPDKLEITSNKSNNGVISASLEVFSQENFMTDLDFWLPVDSGDELNNKLSYRVGVEIDVDKAGIRDYLKTYTKRADPTSNDPIQFYVVNPYDNSNIIQGTLEPLILMDNVKQLTIYFFLGHPQVKAAVDLSIELPFNIGTSMNKNDVKVTKNPNAFNSEFTVDNALLLYENDTESSLVSSSRHILSNNYNYTAYVTLKFDTEINILNECSASLYNTKTKTVMRKTDLSTQTMVPDISKSSDTSNGYIYYISFDIGSPIIPEIVITKDLPESIKLTGAAPSVTLSVDAFCNTGDESAMFFVNVVGEENYTYSWVVSNQNGENWFEDESDVFYYHGMNNKYLTAKDDGSEVECDIFTGQTTLHSSWFKLKATKKGDVNLDGSVNVADMVHLQRYLLGANKNLNSWKAGDICEDGKINVFDLVELRQIVAENAQ